MPKPYMEASIWIACSAEHIWAYLCDVSNEVLWRYGVLLSQWISDPPYVIGSFGFHFIKVLGDYPWTVAEWDELRNVSWYVLDGRFKGARSGYRVSREGTGIRMTIHISANRNVFLRIMMVLMKRSYVRQVEGDLERLKAIIEAPKPSN